jgi:hypothetical protein
MNIVPPGKLGNHSTTARSYFFPQDISTIFAHELQKLFQPQALFFRPFNPQSATLPERLVRQWRSTVIPPWRGFGRCDARKRVTRKANRSCKARSMKQAPHVGSIGIAKAAIQRATGLYTAKPA